MDTKDIPSPGELVTVETQGGRKVRAVITAMEMRQDGVPAGDLLFPERQRLIMHLEVIS